MSTQNGQLVCIEDNLVQTPYGLFITDVKKGELLSPNQLKFLDNISYEFDESKRLSLANAYEKDFFEHIKLHGIDEFIHALKMIHDFPLYHTDLCFDTDEKDALYNLKILWQGLKQVAKS